MTGYIISGVSCLISLVCMIRLFSRDSKADMLNGFEEVKQEIRDLRKDFGKLDDAIKQHGERIAVLEDRMRRN